MGRVDRLNFGGRHEVGSVCGLTKIAKAVVKSLRHPAYEEELLLPFNGSGKAAEGEKCFKSAAPLPFTSFFHVCLDSFPRGSRWFST